MPAAEADTLEPFIFSMIVSITSEDFFALPCGRWMGPTVVAPTFADAKLTFTGGVPADPRLARDFQQSCAKIVQIFESVRPSGTHEQRGVLLKQEDPVSRIKLRFTHRLFQKVEEGEEEDDDIPPAFTIDHWPVRHQQAREAIAGMTATHRVNYLPAYNAIGNLIYPDDYEAQLRGALAQVRFTLSHWNIRQQDVFTANIEHIRILTPPPPHPASPSKRRKFTATDDVSGDISPKKARPANGP
ncbi:hypothetical protein B0H13DRAFT_1014234 [Mycena leptocephala]|nr:hypothetical protein B0H13DRAFT_1014234 [Mycena leptocephala]